MYAVGVRFLMLVDDPRNVGFIPAAWSFEPPSSIHLACLFIDHRSLTAVLQFSMALARYHGVGA
jgi:hypothetical protein